MGTVLLLQKNVAKMISPVHLWVAQKSGLTDNLTPSQLRMWQRERLRGVIDYATKNTRFYKERIAPSMQLTDLPFTLPSDIANDPLAFLAIPQNDVVRVTTLANSGTTTLRKRIFFSKSDLERTKEFFSVGMSTMVSKGDRVQILISNRTENSLGSLLKESLSQIGVTSEISKPLKSVKDAIEVSKHADCLVGMPAELLYMSRTAPEMRPKSVLLAADIAPQSAINGIKKAWKCNVFTHYGHTEFGYGVAVNCNDSNDLHFRDAHNILEIIDIKTQKPALPGKAGEIVITTLSNEAMPLIRYKTGNISRLLTEQCKCGSNLHRLGSIEGRISDNFPITKNKIISILQLDKILFTNSLIRGFAASISNEKGKTTLQITIDATQCIDPTILKSILPKEVRIDIKYGTTDPFTNRRKRRLTIN